MCVDHGFSLPVPKQKRWVGWLVTICIGVQYNSIYIYIYMRGTIWVVPGFFFLLIPFFRLYVEGVFFVDGKCGGGGGGGLKEGWGYLGVFFMCVKERGL